ncbi:MAG TPA: serine hydrolase [Rhizomicrobium sp.]|nr:serine hydrolase [Rhizomicrobium sp.]
MKWIRRSAMLACLCLAGCASYAPDGKRLPDAPKFLFWSADEQPLGYRFIERIFPTSTVYRGPKISTLPLHLMRYDVNYKYKGGIWDTGRFMRNNRVAGLLILKDGRIAMERYAMGLTSTDRWESFSVTKSITSTLIGAAIEDGYIRSLDDKVSDYLPELEGSVYDDVTIRDLITMTSGVKWSERYTDPESDVAKFSRLIYEFSSSPELRYMAKLQRAHPPGKVFNYNTGETSLAGFLVERATHKSLSRYLSEKIWKKIGAGRDAVWMEDIRGHNIGGCCLSMTLRDAGRFGQFILDGGEGVLPKDWVKEATRKQIDSDNGRLGYGYMWWTRSDGTFAALGFFGQMIYIDPKNKIVIVTDCAWREAADLKAFDALEAYIAAVTRVLEDRRANGE